MSGAVERLSCDRCGSVLLVRLETVEVGDIVRASNGASWERLRPADAALASAAWAHRCPPGKR